jgi:hypothetical protein
MQFRHGDASRSLVIPQIVSEDSLVPVNLHREDKVY